MQRRHRQALKAIFRRPVSGSIRWSEIEALFLVLGGRVEERRASRVSIVLFGEVRVFHRPHPSPDTDKGAVSDIRNWFEKHGLSP